MYVSWNNIPRSILFQNKKLCYSFCFKTPPYLLNEVSPGEYSLKCIIDKNKDCEWNTGSWKKKKLPEKVFNYPEEIAVRSNWDLEIDWELK